MTYLQTVLSVVQILFYVVTATVVILTYRNAKRGLLSPVHTEYQKHVIERLKALSQELDAEFDPKSPSYWAADPVPLADQEIREQVDQIDAEFEEKREELLDKGEWEPYTHGHSRRYRETKSLVRSIRADPFIPAEIRTKITKFLTARAEALYEAEEFALNSYRQSLAKGMLPDPRHSNYSAVNNTIVGLLHHRGFNVDQVEEEVENIRLAIQEYLNSYAPKR